MDKMGIITTNILDSVHKQEIGELANYVASTEPNLFSYLKRICREIANELMSKGYILQPMVAETVRDNMFSVGLRCYLAEQIARDNIDDTRSGLSSVLRTAGHEPVLQKAWELGLLPRECYKDPKTELSKAIGEIADKNWNETDTISGNYTNLIEKALAKLNEEES